MDDCSLCVSEGATLPFNAPGNLCCDGLHFDQSTRTCEKDEDTAKLTDAALWSRVEEAKNEHGC